MIATHSCGPRPAIAIETIHCVHVLSADILPCPLCGSARRFEFQVLPHLVHYLGQDAEASESLDFGTIAVYTCSASCDPRRGLPEEEGLSGAYAEEFVWVLPPL